MQQRKQALSWFIETLRLDERRPIVMIENGDVLALVKQELARQKTELLVLGTDLGSGVEHAPTGSAAEATLRSSLCDVLFFGQRRGHPEPVALAEEPTAELAWQPAWSRVVGRSLGEPEMF